MLKTINAYITAKQAEQYSPHTIADYKNTFRKVIAFLGDKPINSISTTDLINFFSKQNNVSRKTVLNYRTALSSLWHWAIDQGEVKVNPVKLIKIRCPITKEIIPYTREDIASLITAAANGHHQERDTAILLTLLDTGARASELCDMHMRHLDLPYRKIIVTGKGSKTRTLLFSNRTREAIRAYLQIEKHDLYSSLFMTEQGKGFTRDTLRLLLDRLSIRSGVSTVYAHRFRHTFAIQFLRNGGNIYILQKLLGHTTLDMVKRYLMVYQTDMDSAMDKSSPVEGWKL